MFPFCYSKCLWSQVGFVTIRCHCLFGKSLYNYTYALLLFSIYILLVIHGKFVWTYNLLPTYTFVRMHTCMHVFLYFMSVFIILLITWKDVEKWLVSYASSGKKCQRQVCFLQHSLQAVWILISPAWRYLISWFVKLLMLHIKQISHRYG